MYEYKLIQHIRVDDNGRMTVVNSYVEHISNPADVLSTALKLIDDWLEVHNQFEKIERNQYIGIRRKTKPRRRYEFVVNPLKDCIAISLPIELETKSGFEDTLFPYLEKYVFDNDDELQIVLSNYLNTLVN